MPKKILVVDDSALMRRVLCDIIDSDIRFQVTDRAKDGLEAFDLLSRNSYDAVVLDVNMPRMNGLQLLQELRKYKIPARVMMASTDTMEGARTTLDALELGALDFVHKPDSAVDCRGENFRREFLRALVPDVLFLWNHAITHSVWIIKPLVPTVFVPRRYPDVGALISLPSGRLKGDGLAYHKK